MDAVAAEREQRFWQACREASAVGVWGDLPILYPCLWPPHGLPASPLKRAFYPLLGEHLVSDEALVKPAEDVWARAKGYAGWLVTEPAFLTQRDALHTQWEALARAERPPFPFVRSFLSEPLSWIDPRTTQFYRALRELLDRWSLIQLTTWDLPFPFVPFLTDYLWRDTQLIPPRSVQLVLPLYYPLAESNELLGKIKERQWCAARQTGLNPSLAALSHYAVLGNMLCIQHLEHTIRSRYVPAGRRTGAVGRLETAIAAALEIGTDQTMKLRKAISACRKGKRASVACLHDRS
jgi:hypothetical protein